MILPIVPFGPTSLDGAIGIRVNTTLIGSEPSNEYGIVNFVLTTIPMRFLLFIFVFVFLAATASGTALGGMYSTNDSKAIGLAHENYWRGKWRFTGVVAAADLQLSLLTPYIVAC